MSAETDPLRLADFELRGGLPTGARLFAYVPGRAGVEARLFAIPAGIVGGGGGTPDPEAGTPPHGDEWPDFVARYKLGIV